MNVIQEITNRQVINYFKLMKEVNKNEMVGVEYNTKVASIAIETGIITGGTVEDLDTMRTGAVVSLVQKVNDALVACMKPDPN